MNIFFTTLLNDIQQTKQPTIQQTKQQTNQATNNTTNQATNNTTNNTVFNTNCNFSNSAKQPKNTIIFPLFRF